MKIVAFSDTHGLHNFSEIPDGDMLIFAGDMCAGGTDHDIQVFDYWMGNLPHKHKIVIAGNHDKPLEKGKRHLINNAIYLQDEEVVIEGIKFYGSPWQPEFNNWSFNLPKNGMELKEKWDMIPDDTDILITHGPPIYILDRNGEGEVCGCNLLLERVKQVNPSYHLFGHIHEGYGRAVVGQTTFLNCSVCNGDYVPCNAPHQFEFEKLEPQERWPL